jgi:hypothetical protein
VDKKGVTEEELRGAAWWVYEEYEPPREGPAGHYIKAAPAFMDAETGRPEPWRWAYEPLLWHENLFVALARWPEDKGMDGPGGELDTDRNAQAAKEWAETYGVLGLTLRRAPGSHSWWANPAGGEGDTVAGFASEAWAANRALRLYESANREGGVDVETIALLASNPVHRDSLERFPDEAREVALKEAVGEIHERAPYYAPALYWPETRGRRPTGRFVQGWRFTNLLGAVWLQALWLLVADPRSVKHCARPACNRIIHYKHPEPPSHLRRGQRKPHKTHENIEYCPEKTGRWCRQKHWRERQRRPL